MQSRDFLEKAHEIFPKCMEGYTSSCLLFSADG